MNEEYLNQAANDYCHVNLYDGKYCRQDVYEAFHDGMKHTMELPLSEKLSERDKAKIIMLQEEIHGEIMRAHDDDDWPDAAHYILDAMPRAFEEVFGSNLFTPTEQ